MRILGRIWSALISLLVDDGFLAVAALVAIAVTWLLSGDRMIGADDLTGWILFGLLAASVVISARRAVRKYLDT